MKKITLFTMLLLGLVCYAQPANDLCTDAITVTHGNTYAGTTINSTFDNVGFCGTALTAGGVWYVFTDISGGPGMLNLSTCNDANYDTKISVYANNCSNLICVGGSDDAAGCAGFTTDLTVNTSANSTYYILVHGFGTATGNFNLTVTFTGASVPPIINCPIDVITGTNPAQCGAVVNFPDAIAVDPDGDLDTVIQTMGPASGSLFPIGDTTIEYTATDLAGNISTCQFIITVNDTEAPNAICQDITLALDPVTGTVSFSPLDIDNGSNDNCLITTLSASDFSFSCNEVGVNPVTLTIMDAAGNTSSCVSMVTVEDITSPDINCVGSSTPLDVILDATGMAVVAANDLVTSVDEACGYTVTVNGNPTMDFNCSNLGINTIEVTVTDDSGNASTCNATINVLDETAPLLVCQDITVSLDENGMAVIDPQLLVDMTATIEACGIDTYASDITEVFCADIGSIIMATVFVSDTSGNSAVCTSSITVIDDLAPEIICPLDQTVAPDVAGGVYTVPDYFDTGEASATDNCTDPVLLTSQSPAAGAMLADGTYTISLAAEDDFGNVSTCEFELIVDSALGIEDQSGVLNFVMYPNPANDHITLVNSAGLFLDTINFYDISGRLTKKVEVGSSNTTFNIDISMLPSGIYLLQVTGEDQVITKNLIKQ